MNVLSKAKAKIKIVLQQAILLIARRARIDILDLAYQQKELCVCDIGEREFLHHVLRNILASSPEPVLVDVGANKGDYTAWLLEEIPAAKVIGFEPNPITFEFYSSRFLNDSRVQAHQIGLSNEIGSSMLYTYSADNTSGHATLAKSVLANTGKSVDSIECRLETLDHLANIDPLLARIAYIKIDVEGYELQVLRGADSVLSNSMLVAIQFEFNSMNVETRVFLKDFYNLLSSRFDFYRLNSKGMEPLGDYAEKNELFTYQNVVAIKKRWAELCPMRWPE